jgi:hypothetical protein
MRYKLYLPLLVFSLSLIVSFSVHAQATADPASLPVYSATGAIAVDGVLDEPEWGIPVPHLMFQKDGVPSGNSFTPTGDAVVKPVYWDESTTYIKFLHQGTNLYISLNSNDQQVCRFGDSWEGDGLFMKIKSFDGTDVELKLYFNLAGTDPDIHYEGPAYGSGAGFKIPGTVVNDSTNVDAGYTAELMIDLTGLGFDASTSSIQVLLNIFDPDNYSDLVGAWGPNGNFYKQWWGSEWGPDMRVLNIMSEVVPVELTSFTANVSSKQIELNWETASETNNLGFEVERASDGNSFSVLGFVEGKGTTTEIQKYSFVDNNFSAGLEYSYRLKQIDLDGTFSYSNVINTTITPVDFSLEQNYPNPFNPATQISFGLPSKSMVNLEVFNLLGEKVATLINNELEAGVHKISFNASQLSAGIYLYALTTNGQNGENYVQAKKMTLIK